MKKEGGEREREERKMKQSMISQSILILGSTNWSKNTLTDQSMGIHDATVQ